MSFEGRYQLLCENRHLNEIDCYAEDYSEFKCRVCNSNKCIWRNLVDDTNEWGEGYVGIEVDVPATHCSCSNCGNTHILKDAIYKIPSKSSIHTERDKVYHI